MTGLANKSILMLFLLIAGCQQPAKVEQLMEEASISMKSTLILMDSFKVYRTSFSGENSPKFGKIQPDKSIKIPVNSMLYRPTRIFVSGDSLICWFWLQKDEPDDIDAKVRYTTSHDSLTTPFVIIHPIECKISQVFYYPLSRDSEDLHLEKMMSQIVKYPDSTNFELSLTLPFLDPDYDELKAYYQECFPEWNGCSSLSMVSVPTRKSR